MFWSRATTIATTRVQVLVSSVCSKVRQWSTRGAISDELLHQELCGGGCRVYRFRRVELLFLIQCFRFLILPTIVGLQKYVRYARMQEMRQLCRSRVTISGLSFGSWEA